MEHWKKMLVARVTQAAKEYSEKTAAKEEPEIQQPEPEPKSEPVSNELPENFHELNLLKLEAGDFRLYFETQKDKESNVGISVFPCLHIRNFETPKSAWDFYYHLRIQGGSWAEDQGALINLSGPDHEVTPLSFMVFKKALTRNQDTLLLSGHFLFLGAKWGHSFALTRFDVEKIIEKVAEMEVRFHEKKAEEKRRQQKQCEWEVKRNETLNEQRRERLAEQYQRKANDKPE
jgi:hypothetical protein